MDKKKILNTVAGCAIATATFLGVPSSSASAQDICTPETCGDVVDVPGFKGLQNAMIKIEIAERAPQAFVKIEFAMAKVESAFGKVEW